MGLGLVNRSDTTADSSRASRWSILEYMPRLLIALLVLASLIGPSTDAQAAEGPPKLLGVATDDFRVDLPDFESSAGRAPAMLQLFWRLEVGWPNAWAEPLLEDVHRLGSTPYVEITVDDLSGFNEGTHDAELEALVESVRAWMDRGVGRQMLVAPLPEANLGQFGWGGQPAGYRAGFRRIREAFEDAGIGPDGVRFVFAMNGPGDDAFDYDSYYPGDGLVDIVGFSKINRGSPWRDYDVTFGIHLEEMKSLVSRSKPILITQTASVDNGGDRAAWLSEMFEGLGADDQVIGVVYFNRLKVEGGITRDYRVLRNQTLDAAFESGWAQWSGTTSWLFDGGLDRWVQSRVGGADSGGSSRFDDVAGSPFVDDIEWLAEAGISMGCNPPANTAFCPDDQITRGQMAAFLVRALGYAESGSYEFSDDDATPFELDVERLAEAGVTYGCDPANNLFCPDDPVSRGQMAAFLRRALDESGSASPVMSFADDDQSVFESDIEWLASVGITTGCAPELFCPDDLVTRSQMAAFLHRALG